MKKNHCGYEYSYLYPGMNKVLQAAGRVIRTETDKGVILVIDERFSEHSYLKLFPREWFPIPSQKFKRTGKRVKRFLGK